LLRHKGKLYVPPEPALREELMKVHHDDALAGHFGAKKTVELLTRKYYWDSIIQDTQVYVKTCDTCQHVQVPRHRPYGELQSLPQPQGPWKEVTMDFITGLPPSRRGDGVYDAILVVVDRYTKMARYIPTTKKLDASDLADLFFQEVIRFFGVPDGIVTDRGSVFTSQFWSEVCFAAKVKRRLSTAFHPQTDGQTERQNQTLERYLRCYTDEKQSNWAGLLPLAEFAYNNTAHSTTGVSPFYACYGYHPRLEYETRADEGSVPSAAERISRMVAERELLAERWRSAVESQAKYYNRKHQPKSY
jgi:transposase InsO family protein